MDSSHLTVEKEQLIEAVRSRPGLWDMSTANYKNVHIRRGLWMEVLTELGLEHSKENIKSLAKKFTTLKYRYQQWLQGTSASGSGGAAKEFPCARLLSFLNDSLKPRKSTSLWNSVEMSTEVETIYEDVEHLDDFTDDFCSFEVTSEEADQFLREDKFMSKEEIKEQTKSCTQNASTSKISTSKTKSLKRKLEEEHFLEKLKMKREGLELKKKFLNSRQQVDPTDTKRIFCDMLYGDLKDMDMAKFRILRRKILDIVDEANAEDNS